MREETCNEGGGESICCHKHNNQTAHFVTQTMMTTREEGNTEREVEVEEDFKDIYAS